MGEPGALNQHALANMPDDELKILFEHEFPGATLAREGEQVIALTIHAVGTSEREVMQRALTRQRAMSEDGRNLEQILNDVRADLTDRGMSRARHDSNMELLDLAENALNAGVITHTVPWIMVPHYTREIEDLRRRTSMRLQMVAQELALNEQARKRAAQKFPRPTPSDAPAESPANKFEGLLWKEPKSPG